MKLSSREKNMLIFFAVLLVCVAVYFFVVEPIHLAYDEALVEYNSIDSTYKIIKTQVKDENEMASMIEDYRGRLTFLETKLPSQIYIEKIINDVFSHFENYDIVMNAVTFNLVESKQDEEIVTENEDGSLNVENLRPALSVEEILDSYEAEEDLSGVTVYNGETISYDYTNIGYMNVSMNFTANYVVFKEALTALSLLDMTVIPTNLAISKTEYDVETADDNLVYVALTVSIPFYYDSEPLEDIQFNYEFEPSNNFETHGPFEYADINNKHVQNVSKPITTSKIINSDFNIGIRNVSSDFPAQSIAYNNIPGSKLDLDSNGNEKYIMDINESGSALSFKYKNDSRSYPTGSAFEVLSTKGEDIVIKVDSSVRINSDDDAGMTLILNNRSSKKVMIYVTGDDPNNPRFNIIVNSGAFEVIRN